MLRSPGKVLHCTSYKF